MGNGYIFYFGHSQDGMGDFWFFPICSTKNDWERHDILDITYKSGVAFKLPLTGATYKRVVKAFQTKCLDEGSFSKKIWYVPVFIEFAEIKKSITLSPSKGENWSIKLRQGNKQLSLSYFTVDEISIIHLITETK